MVSKSIRTVAIFIQIWILTLCTVFASGDESIHNSTNPDGSESDSHTEEEPAAAVLFPWFSLSIGTLAYIAIKWYLPWVPYTASMFIIGTFIGIGIVRLDRSTLLTESVSNFWLQIDPEILLLVFLPGLIAKDAIQLDAGLFQAAFWQCVIFAFPMVLAGTVLTALVCYYVLPYGWSFYLSMTMGAILSATDPVAVASLMSELGAPPRLQIHISGESLLNDGSAIVFFTIFLEMFLGELGITGLGMEIDFAHGVAIFFRMSLGAVASGLMFGLGTLCILYALNRRLNREENVVEVATIFKMAYMGYYVTEQVFHCSGVIGTLTYGLVINKSSYMINDNKLMIDFWALVEYLLNTVLFTLGGLVWGEIISNANPIEMFSATDWGYLFVLYLFLMIIRFFLVFATYPITRSIGLGTNIPEALFAAFAGLRGAVGIALALFVDNVVDKQGDSGYQQEANRLFGFVGGIAFLTLTVNATLSGPLLRKLRLTDKTEYRKKVISVLSMRIRERLIDDMVTLLAETRFRRVNFAVVRHHIPMLSDVTVAELQASVKRFKAPHGKFLKQGSVPDLSNVMPYVLKDHKMNDLEEINQVLHGLCKDVTDEQMHYQRTIPDPATSSAHDDVSTETKEVPLDVVECRRLFIDILWASYACQVSSGDLVDNEILIQALYNSLDFAKADLCNGHPLDDWKYSDTIRHRYPILLSASKFFSRFLSEKIKCSLSHYEMRYEVCRCIAYLEAHRRSREVFKHEFLTKKGDMTEAETKLIKESEEACEAAAALLSSFPDRNVEVLVSCRFCIILLNAIVVHYEELEGCGILTTKEAEDFIEHIEDLILRTEANHLDVYPEEVTIDVDSSMEKKTEEEM